MLLRGVFPGLRARGPVTAAPTGAAAAAPRHARDVAPGAAGTAPPGERRPAPAECAPGGLPGGSAEPRLRVPSPARLCRPFPRGAPEKRAARFSKRSKPSCAWRGAPGHVRVVGPDPGGGSLTVTEAFGFLLLKYL